MKGFHVEEKRLSLFFMASVVSKPMGGSFKKFLNVKSCPKLDGAASGGTESIARFIHGWPTTKCLMVHFFLHSFIQAFTEKALV